MWSMKAKVVIGAFRALTRSAPVESRFQEQHWGSQSKRLQSLEQLRLKPQASRPLAEDLSTPLERTGAAQ